MLLYSTYCTWLEVMLPWEISEAHRCLQSQLVGQTSSAVNVSHEKARLIDGVFACPQWLSKTTAFRVHRKPQETFREFRELLHRNGEVWDMGQPGVGSGHLIHYRDPFLQRFRLSLGVTFVTFMHPNATQLHSPEVGIPHWGSKWHWGSIPVGAHFDTQHGLTQLIIEVQATIHPSTQHHLVRVCSTCTFPETASRTTNCDAPVRSCQKFPSMKLRVLSHIIYTSTVSNHK